MNSPTEPDTKECRRCAVVQPLTDFHRNKATRDGHVNICKECIKAYNETRRVERSEAARRWRLLNPERARETNLRWRTKNPDYAKQYYQEHRKRDRAKAREERMAAKAGGDR